MNRLREYCLRNSGENQLSLPSNEQRCSPTSPSKTNQHNLLQVDVISIHYATEMNQHHKFWNHNQQLVIWGSLHLAYILIVTIMSKRSTQICAHN